MSWFGKAIGAVRAGRAEAHAATALYHLANLISVIDRRLPAELRPELASKIVVHLDRVWEEGKSVRPDVDKSRMDLYGPAFLHRKRQELRDRGTAHNRPGPMSKEDYIEVYSCSIAAYCLDAVVFDNEPDHGGEYNYRLKHKLKEFCEGLAPKPEPKVEPKPETGNAAMVNRVADQLEPFNKEGSVLLKVGSPRDTTSATRERRSFQVSADELPELIGAAERGDVDAQVRLSVAYLTGQGTAQNDARAIHWARCAAEQGNDRGQALLASAHAEGRGVARDAVAAAGWYRRSAEQGNAIAQRQLAMAYINGKGVQRSANEAAKWYQAAAEQGDILAQIGLGASYYGGDGVVQNYAEAAKWYERAAAYGDPNAQGRLADMYARGIGVSQDKVTALMWFLLAGDDVSDDNREVIPAYRARLSAILPPSDVAEAERRAMAWEPRTWPNDPIKDALLRMLPRRTYIRSGENPNHP